jgi:hypothetical protein
LSNGVHMNPQTVHLPGGEPLRAEALQKFREVTAPLLAGLPAQPPAPAAAPAAGPVAQLRAAQTPAAQTPAGQSIAAGPLAAEPPAGGAFSVSPILNESFAWRQSIADLDQPSL